MNYLEIRKLSQKYQKEYILQDLDLVADKGDLLVILGESGCGKTTLLKIVAGLITPEKGKIFLDSRDITALPPQERNVGYVPQASVLFPHMNVRENIIFGLKARKVRREKIQEKLKWIIELAQIEDFLDRFPSQLSGGQKQRVALARAMAVEPQLLLLDEPLSAIDATARESLALTIRRIQKETETTTLYVTHNQEEARLISDKVAVMYNGKIQQIGKINEIDKNPHDFKVAKLVGARNVWPVESYKTYNKKLILETPVGTVVKEEIKTTKKITGIKIPDNAIQLILEGDYNHKESDDIALYGRIKAIIEYGDNNALLVTEIRIKKKVNYVKVNVVDISPNKMPVIEQEIILVIDPKKIKLI